MSNAIDDVVAERKRQIELGYDYKHDNEHDNNELVSAALAYACNDPRFWPWGVEAWKKVAEHKYSKREMYIRATALMVAAIEHMDRESKCLACGGSGEVKTDYSDFRLYGVESETCPKCGGSGKAPDK